MKETTKSNKRRRRSQSFNRIFRGHGIDIGAGNDPLRKEDFQLIESVDTFDKKDGDAEEILSYRNREVYDFVYSSNCLEHMSDVVVLHDWWQLVKIGGYMILTVPDEDLYEQGRFKTKSKWGGKDHKQAFTIFKHTSWCRWSHNIIDLVMYLPDCQIIKIELVDTDYDYTIPYGAVDQTMTGAEAFIEIILRKVKGYGTGNKEKW